jgi:hypothetical protein
MKFITRLAIECTPSRGNDSTAATNRVRRDKADELVVQHLAGIAPTQSDTEEWDAPSEVKVIVELHTEAPIFRTRGGKPVSRPGPAGERGGDRGGGANWAPRPYAKDKLGIDFRTVRALVFGHSEDRNLLDLRRTAAVEAIAGNAEDMQVSAKLANSTSATNSIHKTYDLAQVRAADEARTVGRRRIRENRTGRKV